MRIWNCLLGSLFALSAACASAQTLTTNSNLDFGEWVIQANGASVTMNASSGATNGTNAIGTGVYPITLGSFTTTGPAGDTFTVYTTLGGSGNNFPFTLTGQTSGNTITANAFVFPTNMVNDTGTFSGAGKASFTLGGQLTGLNTTLADDTYVGALPLYVQDNNTNSSSPTLNMIVTIHIQTGIAITKSSDLDFGEIINLGTANGQVVVTPVGRSFTNLSAQSPGPRVGTIASFNVFGSKGSANSRKYQISFAGSGTLGQGAVTLSSGASTMTASLLSYVSGSATGHGQLDTTGKQTFQVGGSLNVGAAQAEGDYTGIFTVTVTYGP